MTVSEVVFDLVISLIMFAAGYATCLYVVHRRGRREGPVDDKQWRRMDRVFVFLLLMLGLATLIDGRATNHDLLRLQECTNNSLDARSQAQKVSNLAQIKSLQDQLVLLATPPGDPAASKVALASYTDKIKINLSALEEVERVRAESPINCRE